jgi:PKD repeat protein
MKKYLSLFVILLAATFFVQAQTITVHLSGTVLRDSTNAPVNDHEVIIQADSNAYNFTFYATRHTNPNGFYDCTISNVPSYGTPVSFIVQTKNCDSTWLEKYFVGTVTYDTVNFTICNGFGACQAAFTWSADTMSPNAMVYFYDQSTPVGLISSWYWNFGDPSSGTNNISTLQNPSHLYSVPGTYTACLTIVTDSNSCTSIVCHEIYAGNTECHASYIYSVDSTNSLRLHFVDTSTPQNAITSRLWNFGDPGSGIADTSSHFDPWHVFTNPGVYYVCLWIWTNTGCTSTYCDSIAVGTNSTSNLNGTAYLGESLYVDHGLAELMKVDSGVATVVNSQEFGDSSGMYWFNGVLPGNYYIRVSLLPSSEYYGQYVPTYYINAVNWNNAILIELGQPENPYNIHMCHANGYSSGNGNISGTITQSGKYNGNGTPAANVEVLLMDVPGNILAFTMTNSSGEFSFTEMAMGTYKVYPEMILKTTTPTTVVLDAAHPGANVVFTITGGSISGIHDEAIQPDFTISAIYPNPVSDLASFTIHTLSPAGITLAVYTITGELVKEYSFPLHAGSNKLTIPASDLGNGLYYIKVERQDGSVFVKKFIVAR